jgi:hypothetical protein
MKFQVSESLDDDILTPHTVQSAKPTTFICSTAITATLYRDTIPPAIEFRPSAGFDLK